MSKQGKNKSKPAKAKQQTEPNTQPTREPQPESILPSDNENAVGVQFQGEQQIHSLDDAMAFFDIDQNVYDIKRVRTNTWESSAFTDGQWIKTNNHQVRVDLEPRDDGFCLDIAKEDLRKWVEQHRRGVRRNTPGKRFNDVGVAAVSDIHVAAEVSKKNNSIVATREFNTEKLIRYLEKAKQWINSQNKSSIHLFLLGDLIESITGLNHINSWQGMEHGTWYEKPIILAYEILRDFLDGIRNLVKIYVVAGNHDRITSNNAEDTRGSACAIVCYMLEMFGFDVEFHPMILNKVIDGISYVATHGHLNMIKKSIGHILWQYGQQGLYNVLMSGHLHTRKSKVEFHTLDQYVDDSVSYRAVVVPSIFTGNWHSESHGFTSSAGFAFFQKSAGGKNVTHTDVGL